MQRPNLGAVYSTYRKETSDSGRRTRDQMRHAGIMAAVLGVAPMFAMVQPFETPSVFAPSDESLKRTARRIARRLLVDEGAIRAEQDAVPPSLSPTDAQDAAVRRLGGRGIRPPVHPSIGLGWHKSEMPDAQFLGRIARVNLRDQFGPIQRLVGRQYTKALAEEVKTLYNALLEEQERWREKKNEYETLVREEAEALVSAREAERDSVAATNALEDDKVEERSREVEKEQFRVLELIRDAYKRYRNGDETLVSIVLQACFSDNGGTAAPVGSDQGDLLVLMSVPSRDSVVWPEEISFGQTISARKRKKAEIAEEFENYVFCHAVATARESMMVATNSDRVRVIVLDDEDSSTDLLSRRVIGALNWDRRMTSEMEEYHSESTVAELRQFVQSWFDADARGDSAHLYGQMNHWETTGVIAWSRAVEHFGSVSQYFRPSMESWVQSSRSARPVLRDLIDEGSSGEEVETAFEVEDDDLDVLSLDVAEVGSAHFWVLASLIADVWEDDEIDVDELRTVASTIASVVAVHEQ